MDRNRRELLIFFVVLAVLAGGAFIWWKRANPGPARCEMCDRPIHRPTAFSAVAGGRRIWACCPKCGLATCAKGKEAKGLEATDFASGKVVPAERCAYVVGSDLTPCCSPEVIVDRDKVACGRCFDHCFPSAIAFADPRAALAFSSEHGGKILPFQTLVEELKRP
jgi:hypothetical protein